MYYKIIYRISDVHCLESVKCGQLNLIMYIGLIQTFVRVRVRVSPRVSVRVSPGLVDLIITLTRHQVWEISQPCNNEV